MSDPMEEQIHRDMNNTRAGPMRKVIDDLRMENARLLAANRDVMLHWEVLKSDYERLRAALRLAQRGLDPYATYETQLEARVVVDGICAALEEPK